MLTATLTLLLDHHPGRYHDGWGDGSGGWWLWGLLMMAAWIGLVVWAVVTLARRSEAHHHHPHGRAREILAERYARGELSTDEYNERLGALGP